MRSALFYCLLAIALVVTAAGCSTVPAAPAPTPAPTAALTPSASPTTAPMTDPAVGATPTPEQTRAPQAQDVLYSDDFTDKGSGWPGARFDNYFIGYHEPTFYHVDVSAPHDSAVVVAPGQNLADFTAEAEVFADEANTATEGDFRYGLVARRSGQQYYAFTLSPRTRAWYVLKNSPDARQVLAQGVDAPQGQEGKDRLKLDAVGDTFVFYINDQPVSQVSDSAYPNGEIGFFVETFDAPRAHIHYDTLTIRPAQAAPQAQDVLYSDDFTDKGSGWPGARFDNYFIGYHEPTFYHVDVSAAHDSAVVVAPGQSLADFTAEAEVFADEANTATEGDFRYGLVARRSGQQYYAFTLSPRTRAWYVLKNSPDGRQVLAQGVDAPQGQEGKDRLKIDIVGDTFVFYINDQPVNQVSDTSYPVGEIGFFVETFDAPRAHIHYDTLTIQPAQTASSPEPKPTQVQPSCRVAAFVLNLRSQPDRYTGKLLRKLDRDTRLQPLSRSPDAQWIQVVAEGTDLVGWVAHGPGYTTCDFVVTTLPVNNDLAQ